MVCFKEISSSSEVFTDLLLIVIFSIESFKRGNLISNAWRKSSSFVFGLKFKICTSDVLAGLNIVDVVMSNEYRTIVVMVKDSLPSEKEIREFFEKWGRIDSLYKFRNSKEKTKWGKVTFMKTMFNPAPITTLTLDFDNERFCSIISSFSFFLNKLIRSSTMLIAMFAFKRRFVNSLKSGEESILYTNSGTAKRKRNGGK
jgi:hypothetical protein